MRFVRSPLFGLVLVALTFAFVFSVVRKPKVIARNEADGAAVVEGRGEAAGTLAEMRESGVESVGGGAPDVGAQLETTAGTATASASAAASAAGDRTTSGAPLRPVAKLIPRIENVRDEVAKNPHGTPESLSRLSLSLGDRLDALKSESEGSAFIDELDECVTKPPVATTSDAKTLCLLNAKRVGEKFPALEAKAASLQSRAPENVRKALEFLK